MPVHSTEPNQGTTIALVGDICRFLATGAETDGKYALLESVVPPGGGPPPHVHHREQEGFYILEGEVAFYAEDQRIVARRGMSLNLPPGRPHSFRNESNQPARMLITLAPAGLEQMFLEVGRAVPAGTVTVDPPGPAEIEKLLATAPRYGVEMLLPKH
jgi:mannose-6-phosphate isomerase-like protein (cupin superfamily)